MGALSPILRNVAGGRLAFWCPGCKSAHQVIAQVHAGVMATPDPSDPDWTPPQEYYEARGGAWAWNGSARWPSFQPSILVTYPGPDAGRDGAPPAVCHSFVTNGRIQFLGDSTHALAGQTVDMVPWPAPPDGDA